MQWPQALLTKTAASKVLIGVVVSLILLKAGIAYLTDSISIIAQATDSLLDLFAGIITFSAVRMASKPADLEHPYGHGKVENIGGILQGVLIFLAGSLIIYASARRIIEGAAVEMPVAGVGVMGFSILASLGLSRYLFKVAGDTSSVALEANAHNIQADIYSALAVLIGLLVVEFTGLAVIDPIIAIGVSLYIFYIAYHAFTESATDLVDTRLSPQEEDLVRRSVEAHSGPIAGYHYLRTRRSGSQRYIDFHIVMDKEISLDESHHIADSIETEIEEKLPEASVTIHVEPCDESCAHCRAICKLREEQPKPGRSR